MEEALHHAPLEMSETACFALLVLFILSLASTGLFCVFLRKYFMLCKDPRLSFYLSESKWRKIKNLILENRLLLWQETCKMYIKLQCSIWELWINVTTFSIIINFVGNEGIWVEIFPRGPRARNVKVSCQSHWNSHDDDLRFSNVTTTGCKLHSWSCSSSSTSGSLFYDRSRFIQWAIQCNLKMHWGTHRCQVHRCKSKLPIILDITIGSSNQIGMLSYYGRLVPWNP